LSGIFAENKGKLPWPVKEGVIIEKFGQHNHPVFKHIKLPFNNGVNIATSLNSEVMVVFDGVVKQILVMPGYNQCVLVQHGNYYTFYTKMEKVRVSAGDQVKTGEVLGILTESEGNSVLHFQLWQGTSKQNPEHWISKN
jgi:murein DD-endopeptidase MepM/ murein hydrolase activator NlpD